MADELGKLSINLDVSQALKEAEKIDAKLKSIDTELDVTADTKQAEKQLKDLTGKKSADIKVNAETGKAKSELKELTKDQEVEIKVTADEGGINSLIDGVKGKFQDLGGGLNEAFGSLKGGDIAGAFGQLTGSVTSFLGPVGLATGALVGFGSQIVDIVNETNTLQTQVANLTNLTGSELTNVTAGISAISKTFDKDFNETMLAANGLAKAFGITYEEALAQIEQGILKGADANGEFLAQAYEYSGFFKEAGYDAQKMSDYLALAAKEGIFSDKAGDLVKEFGLRIREMGQGSKDALAGIGISGDELQAQLKAGTITQEEALAKITKKMGEYADNSSEVGLVIADVFGGPGEDVGAKFLKLLGDQEAMAKKLGKAYGENSKLQSNQLELTKMWELAFGKLAEVLYPVIDAVRGFLVQGIMALVDGFKTAYDVMQPFIAFIKDYFLTVWDNVVQIIKNVVLQFYPLYELIKALWPVLKYALIPLLAPLAAGFGVAYGAMKLLNVILKALGELFLYVGNIIKREVAPVFAKIGDTIDGFVDKVISLAKNIPGVGSLLKKFGLDVSDVGDKTKKGGDGVKDGVKSVETAEIALKKFATSVETTKKKVKDGIITDSGALKTEKNNLNLTLNEIAKKYGLTGAQTEKYRKQVEALKITTSDLGGASKEELSDLQKLEKAYNDNKSALEKLALSGKKNTQEYEDQFKKTKQAKDELEKYKKTIDDVTKSLEEKPFENLWTDELQAKLDKATEGFKNANGELKTLIENSKKLKPVEIPIEVDTTQFLNIEDLNGIILNDIEEQAGTASDQLISLATAVKDAYTGIGTALGEALGKALTDGELSLEDFADAALKVLYSTVSKAVLIYTPQILAAFTAMLGPFGIPAGLAAIGIIEGFLAAAPTGFETGGFTGTGRNNEPAGIVHKNEYVANARTTKRERQLFEFLERGGTSQEFFMQHFQDMNLSRPQYSNLVVNQDGVIQELKSVKHELEVIKRASIDTARKTSDIKVDNKIVLKNDYWR